MTRFYAPIALAGLFLYPALVQRVGSQPHGKQPVATFAGVNVQVSSQSPFPPGCSGELTGAVYENGPVEPFVAVDPINPAYLVGVWQQDRWVNRGAHGVLAAASLNSGPNWRPARRSGYRGTTAKRWRGSRYASPHDDYYSATIEARSSEAASTKPNLYGISDTGRVDNLNRPVKGLL
jgi:hypothetical protein